MKKISVCMAVYNGEAYIYEQLKSITNQLSSNDEIIISDDGSNDNTIEIIKSFSDPRIKIYYNSFHNHILNFEFALKQASGDYIFLSDQDDVWLENKVKIMKGYLENYDVVCSDCIPTDSNLNPILNSYTNKPVERRKGLLTNFIKNNYLGCCMAFNRRVLLKAVPFPAKLITHDTWIGLVGEIIGKTKFIGDKLIFFRRHSNNTSNTLNGSTLKFYQKLHYRYIILKGLIRNIYLR